MTVNIEKEIDYEFGFDEEKAIEQAIIKTLDYMKFPYDAEVNVIITSEEEIQIINNEHRQIDRATDVLSFPMIEYEKEGDFEFLEDEKTASAYCNPDTGEILLGDIVLCAQRITSQAKEYGHSKLRELTFLVVHSMLHLFGYDHINDDDKTMENLQRDILNDMGITREDNNNYE